MSETMIMETMHYTLQSKQVLMGLASRDSRPSPATLYRPKPPGSSSRRVDPQSVLEPARKKLSTLEAQRIMSAMGEGINRAALTAAVCQVAAAGDLDNLRIALGAEVTAMLEEHAVILRSYLELTAAARDFRRRESRATPSPTDKPVPVEPAMEGDTELGKEGATELGKEGATDAAEETHDSAQVSARSASPKQAVLGSARDNLSARSPSMGSQSHMASRNQLLVERRMRESCRNILRALGKNPPAATALLQANEITNKQGEQLGNDIIVTKMHELRDIVMSMMLTTPVELDERSQCLHEISEKERYNAGIISKHEAELNAFIEERDRDVEKQNDTIRRLQYELHQLEKNSDEQLRGVRSEADKQEAADRKSSEGKMAKLQQELNQTRSQYNTLVTEHRESEQNLRKKKFQVETEVENWIQKYDSDMGERQDEYEEIDAVYTQEKRQLFELEVRFKDIEAEYSQIVHERRLARERREAAEREMLMCVRAATTIQAFWRSFKVRKALKGRRKKGTPKASQKKGKK